MDDDLKLVTSSVLDGEDVDAGRLESDPKALGEFVDQLQIHHRLTALLRPGDPIREAVVRELRLLPDASRFSREVVQAVKRLEPPGRRLSRLLPLWAAAAFLLAVLAALFFRPAERASLSASRGTALFIVGALPLGPGDAPAESPRRTAWAGTSW